MTMTHEQAAAIFRATGKYPPDYGPPQAQQALLPTASPVTLPSASASANCKRKWVSLVDTTGNVLRDVPLPRPRSIQHQLTAARPKMPYAAVMNRKGINREAAAHFLERLDWMVSHLHFAPEHNDGCMHGGLVNVRARGQRHRASRHAPQLLAGSRSGLYAALHTISLPCGESALENF